MRTSLTRSLFAVVPVTLMMVSFQNFSNYQPDQLSPTAACDAHANANCAYVADLLDQREGFGAHTTGGLNAPVVYVTNTNDSGPGSLREALTSPDPAWIRFNVPNVVNHKILIRLRSPIEIQSNKTLDGRGAHVRIVDQGFRIFGHKNIIITSVQIGMSYSTADQARIDFAHVQANKYAGMDAITLAFPQTKNIWIHHCLVEHFSDGLIDITHGATDVTLSWNLFRNHNKGFAIGLAKAYFIKKGQTNTDGNIRVTFHHNRFLNITQRQPRVSQATVHAYNNVYENWGSPISSVDRNVNVDGESVHIPAFNVAAGYVVHAADQAHVLMEKNVFKAGHGEHLSTFGVAATNPKAWNETPGYLRYDGNLNQSTADAVEYQPANVEAPSYPQSSKQAANDQLVHDVTSNAGLYPVTSP